MNTSTIIVRNLRQRALRNLATLFSVTLVAGLMTVFISGRHFFDFVDELNNLPQVVVAPTFPFTVKAHNRDTDKIKAVPNVDTVTRALSYRGFSPDKRFTFTVSGMDDTYFTVINGDGAWFPTTPAMVEAWRRDKAAFIVGEETAKQLGLEVGHSYNIATSGGNLEGHCVGIARGGANKTNMEFQYDYIDRVLGKEQGDVTMWLVSVKSQADVEPAILAVDTMFKTADPPTLSTPASDHVRTLTAAKRGVVGLLGIITVMILFVTLFVSMNTVLFLVRERRQVLATLRAIGFRNGSVVSMVVAEIMLLCMTGGIIGVGVICFVFRRGIPLGSNYLSAITVPPAAIATGLLAAALIGIISSVPPAWLAARAKIVDALRDT